MTVTEIKNITYHLFFLRFKDLFYRKQFNKSDKFTKIIDGLNKNGIYIIEDYYNENQCKELRIQIDTYISNNSDEIWMDDTESDQRIFGAEIISPQLKNFYSDPFLHEIAERYLKTTVGNLFTLASRTLYKKKNIGSGGGWHRDNSYHPQIKAIIYLDDVKESNGPFSYLLGTHKTDNLFDGKVKSDIKKYDFRATQEFIDQVKSLGYSEKKYTAKKGTLILTDTKGLHRGNPINEGTRYALFNYFIQKHYISSKIKAKFGALTISKKS